LKENNIIYINRLTKIYHGTSKPAVDDVSLNIQEGEVFGLLGPNGAGKSTIINILCGLLSPTSGQVLIHKYILGKNNYRIKELIGVVPQDIALYPSLTAKENLFILGKIYGLRNSHLKDRIHELLAMFGLEQNKDRRISYFSGGMKRRMNLIAGIIHNPKILFLDEPTVGIDVQSKKVILDNLFEINKKGTTIVYTSHLMEEVQKICTRIAFIDEGKIVSEGVPLELISSDPSFRNLEDVYLNLTGKKLRD
jgi:ABC-2 type transport system ATP-binding protein